MGRILRTVYSSCEGGVEGGRRCEELEEGQVTREMFEEMLKFEG